MDKEKKYEIRSFGGDAAPKSEGESRTVEGYAIVFNQRSQVMWDWMNNRSFVEEIKPTAVNDALLRSCDIKALLEHNYNRMIARSYKGAGTLKLSLDAVGLKYRFDAPNTEDGNYALEMVKRGDLFGSSFAYTADEKVNVTYRKDGDTVVRIVNKIDHLYDVSIVSDPAYMGTSVETRSLEKYYEKGSPAPDDLFKQDLAELRSLSKI